MNLKKCIILAVNICIATPIWARSLNITDGDVSVVFDRNSRTYSLRHKKKNVTKGAYVTATLEDGSKIDSRNYPKVSLKKKNITDGYGKGKVYTYTYSGANPGIEQNIYVYPDLGYFLVDATLTGENNAASHISPIVSDTSTDMPLPGNGSRIYDMPFANDNWATFHTYEMKPGSPVTSCEATVIFNADNRDGIIIGSVDHSTWKSAVTLNPSASDKVGNLDVQAGYISDRTWDVLSGKSSATRHGVVKGERVASPRFMIGYYDDWRTALEEYGDANTVVCPKMSWDKDNALFGWQSWGGMEFGLNYESAMSLLDFYEKELLPAGFTNDKGRTLMVLDSGWGALNEDQLKNYVAKCKSLNMVPGIYATPFSYWGSEKDAVENREWEGGRLGEMAIKSNGRYRHINAVSLDPTHPKVKELNERNFKHFRDLGFEFVKIDFMNNGSQEADSFYLPGITTGMQAYNYGMDYLVAAAGDMMLDFSIAPVFPAKAHVRRIGCDAWGDLPQSMYTLNCINGSWWLDRCYAFNDPDHMTLSKVALNGKGSNDEQEARIRYTCGLLTGMTLLGGTYAYNGPTIDYNGGKHPVTGTDEERARVVKFASNKDLMKMGNIGRSFRPVEGRFSNKATLFSQDDISVDNEFTYDNGDEFYYVVFNYNTDKDNTLSKKPDYGRIGLVPENYSSVKELWTGVETNPAALRVEVPSKDVRIYRFSR